MLLERVRSTWTRITSFTRLLHANAVAARGLNDALVAEYGITMEQYEVLSRLALAPDRPMRVVDISEPPLVTAPKIQRVLDDLERSQLVERGTESGTPAVALTGEGSEMVQSVTSNHSAELQKLGLVLVHRA